MNFEEDMQSDLEEFKKSFLAYQQQKAMLGGAGLYTGGINPYLPPTTGAGLEAWQANQAQYLAPQAPTGFTLPSATQQSWIDPATGKAVSISAPTAGVAEAADPFASKKKAIQNELMANLAISGGAQALQTGLDWIPTQQDRYTTERLGNRNIFGKQTSEGEIDKELAQLEEDAENVGLSSEEKALMQRQALAPVQALARENRMRQEAAAASMGGGTSLAQQVAAQREAQRQVASQATQAGLAIEQMDIAEAARELDEIEAEQDKLKQEREELMAYRSARTQQRLGNLAQLAGGTAGLLGQYRGAQALKTVDRPPDWDQWDPATQNTYLRMMGSGNEEDAAMMQLMRAWMEREAKQKAEGTA